MAAKNQYGEWAHTVGGQPVIDNVALKHESEAGSYYCRHCPVDMASAEAQQPCEALERARRRQINPATVLAFGCDHEANGGTTCEKWCQGLLCSYSRPAAGET